MVPRVKTLHMRQKREEGRRGVLVFRFHSHRSASAALPIKTPTQRKRAAMLMGVHFSARTPRLPHPLRMLFLLLLPQLFPCRSHGERCAPSRGGRRSASRRSTLTSATPSWPSTWPALSQTTRWTTHQSLYYTYILLIPPRTRLRTPP